MVFPTANQASKSISDQNVGPEKQTFSSIYAAVAPAGENGNLNSVNVSNDDKYGNIRTEDTEVPPPPVYVPVKAATGRKQRSGWCLAGTFGAGVLVALTLVALTVVFVKVLCGDKKSGWVAVDDEHKCHEHKHGDDNDHDLRHLMRGKRPYMEPGTYVLEWMEIEDGIWGIDVPNFGHDAFGNIGYQYSIVVDFHKQLAAIKVGDSTNAFAPECYVGHTYDLGIPDQDVVQDFLGDVEHKMSMHVDKMQYYYFDPVPLQQGRSVGDAIENFCSGVPTFALEPVVAEIKEEVEKILELLGTSYEDMGELVDDLVESSVELMAGDRDKIKDVFEHMEEVLTYVPQLPSGKYSFEGKHGVALSLNIRRTKREEMKLRKNLWALLEGEEEEDDEMMT